MAEFIAGLVVFALAAPWIICPIYLFFEDRQKTKGYNEEFDRRREYEEKHPRPVLAWFDTHALSQCSLPKPSEEETNGPHSNATLDL